MKSKGRTFETLAAVSRGFDQNYLAKLSTQSSLEFKQFVDALATLAYMVEIPEGVWTRPLEIEQSYELVHEEKNKTSVLVIEE